MLLAELDVEYELVLVDRKTEAQKSSEYLKLNPTGRIPTLIDQGSPIFESAAICLHLCDKHPEKGLAPHVGAPNRPLFFQWLFYLTTSVQSELMVYFYPEKHTQHSHQYDSIRKTQEQRVTEMFSLIDRELEGQKYLVGNNITICDLFLFMLAHWASGFEKAPINFQNLNLFMRRLSARETIKKVCKIEGTDLTRYNQT